MGNSDHTDRFGLLDTFYGRKNVRLDVNGNPARSAYH